MNPPGERVARIVAPIAARGRQSLAEHVDRRAPGFVDGAFQGRPNLGHVGRVLVREEVGDRLNEGLAAAPWRFVPIHRHTLIVSHVAFEARTGRLWIATYSRVSDVAMLARRPPGPSPFDPSPLLPYTRFVRRLIIIQVGFALAAAAGPGSALHVHAYTDHDHPEHHHGLAAHEHYQAAHPDEEDDGPHLESCDPGQHSVSLVMGCAQPPPVHVLDAVHTGPIVVAPIVPIRSVTEVTDVRVHGPPPRTPFAPRGPPLSFPA
jgi:hypothetical protein